MQNLRCIACKNDDIEVREMRLDEIAKLGYTPEDTRVCEICGVIWDSIEEMG